MQRNNSSTTLVWSVKLLIHVSVTGNLHFLWTERSDNDYIYACSTKNDVMLVEVRNTQTIRLSVKNGE